MKKHWPVNVTVNGEPVAVLEVQQKPMLRVKPGQYQINGQFNWQQRPQYLQIPNNTALLSVTIDGQTLTWPNIDQTGRLWFKQNNDNAEQSQRGDSVKVEVFRRLQDGVPMTMQSVLRLVVSGKPRELKLGRFLLDDSEITRFNTKLPARIETDGTLRIQVRAGNWEIYLSSRFTKPVSEFNMTQTSDNWPSQEIWSFAAHPNIRGVKISGVNALDPSQLDMPKGWSNLPTYLVEPNNTFIIEEQYRGDITPNANQINLSRTVWLDFDGNGTTIKDNMQAVMYQDWRLSVQSTMQLGRVAVNGMPQLVTQLPGQEHDGVEVRQRNVSLEAISRLQSISDLSAVGWENDVDKLSMQLNLPPGWRLWHSLGPDSVNASWLSRWNLWNLFLCLLIVGATFKLLGLPWAVLAGFTQALTYHESNAPVVSWVVLIIVFTTT